LTRAGADISSHHLSATAQLKLCRGVHVKVVGDMSPLLIHKYDVRATAIHQQSP
jgi:hypothetical protein